MQIYKNQLHLISGHDTKETSFTPDNTVVEKKDMGGFFTHMLKKVYLLSIVKASHQIQVVATAAKALIKFLAQLRRYMFGPIHSQLTSDCELQELSKVL